MYITLDLTTHNAPALTFKKSATKSNKKSDKVQPGRNSAEPEQTRRNSSADVASPSVGETPGGRLQVLGLHTDHPLIAYNNSFYQCNWATDIGTSVFISAPKERSDSDQPPLRAYRSFDLLGTSSARLMAVPATLKPRVAELGADRRTAAERTEDETVMVTSAGDTIRTSETHGLQIDLPVNAPAEKVAQARFLERLSAIKKRRGESNRVPVKAVKAYNRPLNWEAQRESAMTKEQARRERTRIGSVDDDEHDEEHDEDTTRPQIQSASATPRAGAEEAVEMGGENDVTLVDPERAAGSSRRTSTPSSRSSSKRQRSVSQITDKPADKKPRWSGPTGRPPGRPRKIVLDANVLRQNAATPTVRPVRDKSPATIPGGNSDLADNHTGSDGGAHVSERDDEQRREEGNNDYDGEA